MSVPDTFSECKIFLNTHFQQNIWDKTPAQVKLPSGFEICSETHLLESLRRYSAIPEVLKKNNSLAEFVTGVNNLKTEKPVNDFSIGSDENNLDSYLNRVDGMNKDGEWSIAYFGLHGASPVIWDRAKQFVDALSDVVGARPGGRVDVDCFIGRYSSTPSGIHTDDAHNFGFTFRSGKTMFTWPGHRKELCRLKSPDYDLFKKDSCPLENNPGYVCYFPHDTLHVGETKEKVSVNLNISLWKAEDVGQPNIQYLASQLRNITVTEKPLASPGPARLSEVEHENLSTLRKILSNGNLERQMALSHLLDHTTSGMKVPRPIFEKRDFDGEHDFRLRETATLQWYETESKKELFIGANGHCVSCAYDEELAEFLGHLSRRPGQGYRKMNLKDMPKSRYLDFKDLASLLYQCGAIEEVSQSE